MICHTKVVQMRTVLFMAWLLATPAVAEPMTFHVLNTGGNRCCRWIQATGEITPETPKAFDAFYRALQYPPGTVRLHSPGGSLVGGIGLGETFRAHGLDTAVGSSDFKTIDETPGVCASACAYAFLGGVERSLAKDAKLGFHRFYVKDSSVASSVPLFTGTDLDAAQKTTAALVLYAIKMGIDARLITVASEAGPDQMRWIKNDEARDLRVTYQPLEYKPWRIEAFNGGAVAVSESNDGIKSIVASCSKRFGPNVMITNYKPIWDVASWFEQCRKDPFGGSHTVFGAQVAEDRVQVLRRNNGSVTMRFQLPNSTPPLSSPELLSVDVGYSGACATNEYRGARENFVAAVRLALRACIQD
jgi:hypothetical protein